MGHQITLCCSSSFLKSYLLGFQVHPPVVGHLKINPDYLKMVNNKDAPLTTRKIFHHLALSDSLKGIILWCLDFLADISLLQLIHPV